uniref:Uncharacterized protein n=1 Tax=Romanomermis culicivorax TaxID=13658 RepID=A0A915JQZ9_ROMCU
MYRGPQPGYPNTRDFRPWPCRPQAFPKPKPLRSSLWGQDKCDIISIFSFTGFARTDHDNFIPAFL